MRGLRRIPPGVAGGIFDFACYPFPKVVGEAASVWGRCAPDEQKFV